MNSTNLAWLMAVFSPRISSNKASLVFETFFPCTLRASTHRETNIAPVKSSLFSPTSGAAAAVAFSILVSSFSNMTAASFKRRLATNFCSRSLIIFFCLSRSACRGPTLTRIWLNSLWTLDSPAFMSRSRVCSVERTVEMAVCASCCALIPRSTAASTSAPSSPLEASVARPSAMETAILTSSSAAVNFSVTSALALAYFLSLTSFLTPAIFCAPASARVSRASSSSHANLATLSVSLLAATRFTAMIVLEPPMALAAACSAALHAAARSLSFVSSFFSSFFSALSPSPISTSPASPPSLSPSFSA
mmetsp:Transcript_124826/g.312160  ORF Transcript_124826/g.312160 Transcript_124826/m.312160 type:complete len:306 (-) Transcript_124826:2407-3324(-)